LASTVEKNRFPCHDSDANGTKSVYSGFKANIFIGLDA
jgi:hypothetical protein